MEKVFEIYIKTTPERLWEAITDPEMRSQCWPMILSGLKTLLETGETLETPGSQRFSEPSKR